MSASPVHVIGATGRIGARLCRLLHARGVAVVPVVRDLERWAALGLPIAALRADLTDPGAMARALAGARRIVSVSYAAWTGVILQAAPPDARLVVTGTARRYAARVDVAGRDAAAAEALLLASGRNAAILHPTLVYGSADDNTVSRMAALLRRARHWPVLPVPGADRLVQPIHADDLATALAAAIDRGWSAPVAIAVGGPAAVRNADLLAAIARAAGLPVPRVLRVPDALVRLAAGARPELRRLLEDRAVDPAPMRAALGLVGRPLSEGLAQQFKAGR